MADWQERIEIDPVVLAGKPVIRGMRLAVEFILDLPAQGWTADEVIRNYPGLLLPGSWHSAALARSRGQAGQSEH